MKVLHFILFMGFTHILMAQHSISGMITDEQNQPIIGTEVYIEQLHIGTTSDFDGKFVLKNIPKGTHNLTISYVGYTTINKEITILNENLNIDFNLSPSVFHMDEIIVSAPFHKLQSENVMKIESKPISTLSKNGMPTLVQNLTSIPGIEQQSVGLGIGKPVIRGLTGNRVLIYTQGVRLENQQFGGEHGLGLNDSGIESVEVIKGPASLLYGSDALGGVLYFNPEKFAFQNETEINISQNFYSNTLGSNTSAGVKTTKGIVKLLARGTFNAHSDYKVPNGERVENTRFNEKDFKTGIGLNFENFVTELRYNYNTTEVGIPHDEYGDSHSKSLKIPFQDLNTHILSLHNHIYFDESRLDFNFGFTQNNRKEFEDHDDHEEEHHDEEDHHEEHDEDEHHEEASLNMRLNTLTYEGKYYLPELNKFETIIGIQGMYQTNENFGEEILIPDASTNDIGFLATTLFALNEKNSIQGGIRYDHRSLSTDSFEAGHHEEHEDHEEEEDHEDHEEHEEHEIVEGIDRDYGNFTFSLGYKTVLFDKLTTRLNLARGFRAPNTAELTSHGVHHGTNRFEIGNPNLESEQNIQTDISIDYNSEHIEFFVNGFYNKINNYIYATPNGEFEDEHQVFEYVQNDAKLYGGEFGLHFHPHPLDWFHIESTYEMVIGKQDNGDYLPLIPANKWSNAIRGEFDGNHIFNGIYTSLRLDSYMDQENISDFETNTDGYNLLHFSAGSKIKMGQYNMGVNFSINNLLNKEYIPHLSALKPNGILNPGRNFNLGLSLNI